MSLKSIFLSLCLCVSVVSLAGCTEMDEKILGVDQKYYDTGKLTMAAARKACEAWESTESSRNSLEVASIEGDTARFLDRHTSADGRMVSLDAGGNERPLLRADLEMLLKDRDTRLVAARLNHERNRSAITALRNALAQYEAASDLWFDRKVDYVEKRKSLAAAANAALSALGSAGGMGLIMGLAL